MSSTHWAGHASHKYHSEALTHTLCPKGPGVREQILPSASPLWTLSGLGSDCSWGWGPDREPAADIVPLRQALHQLDRALHG